MILKLSRIYSRLSLLKLFRFIPNYNFTDIAIFHDAIVRRKYIVF